MHASVTSTCTGAGRPRLRGHVNCLPKCAFKKKLWQTPVRKKMGLASSRRGTQYSWTLVIDTTNLGMEASFTCIPCAERFWDRWPFMENVAKSFVQTASCTLLQRQHTHSLTIGFDKSPAFHDSTRKLFSKVFFYARRQLRQNAFTQEIVWPDRSIHMRNRFERTCT